MKARYSMTNGNITVFIKGKRHVLTTDDPEFITVKRSIENGRDDENDLEEILDRSRLVAKWSGGRFYMKDDKFYSRDGTAVPESMSRRMLKLLHAGQSPAPVFNFWERLNKNPSFRSVNQLWGFMEHTNIPLTDSGHILTYKTVRQDFKDHHSGTFENRPGKVLEMPRNQISDDQEVACHVGFHVGALGYVRGGPMPDGRVVICRVDPADVVCVPNDHSQQKVRVCRYEVVGQFSGELPDDLVHDADLPVIADRVEVKNVEEERAAQKKQRRGASPSVEKLHKMSLSELRTFASRDLHIIGASKIPGGKWKLIEVILSNPNGPTL